MTDNDSEGHSGVTIAQIVGYTKDSLQLRPNFVLLHAGTNDYTRDVFATATSRPGQIVDQIVAACPDAIVLVAQITPTSNSIPRNTAFAAYNTQIARVVAVRQAASRKSFAVDHYSEMGMATDYADGLHPNDAGYAIMARTWYRAMTFAAEEKGWYGPPVKIARKTKMLEKKKEGG